MIVGRRQERAALQRAVDSGLAGSPGVVAIIGEAGIGKSTLAADLAASARAHGARVVYGTADELDRSSFGLWHEPWARLGGEGGLLDTALGPDEQRWDVLARLSESLQRAAPVVVVVEDLHWTDALSAWVLARLAPGLAGVAVAIVATSRPVAAGALVSLVRPTEVLHLAGLDEAEVGELALSLAPEAEIDAAALRARTGGNPLLVRELVRAPAAGIKGAVGTALEHSLAPLRAESRRVLAALSVAGADTSIAILSSALQLPSDEVVRALDDAVEHDVLVRVPLGGIAFRHALLADAAAASLSDGEHRALHNALASAWAESSAPGASARAARHLVAAVPAVDAATAAAAAQVAATTMLERGDLTGAAELLDSARAALDLADPPELALHASILLDLAEAREAAGDVVAAGTTFEAAAQIAAGTDEAETLARAEAGAARRINMWVDEPDRRRRLEQASQRLPAGDHPLRVALYGRLSVACLARPELAPDAISWGDQAVAMARRIGNPTLLATALIDRHFAPITPEELAALGDVTAELLAVAERSGRADHVMVGLQWQYADCVARADPAGAHAAVRRLEALGAVMPSPVWRYGALLRRAMLLAFAGERELALECIDRGWSLCEGLFDPQESSGVDVGARSVLAWIFGYSDPELIERFAIIGDQLLGLDIAFFDVHYSLAALMAGHPEPARAIASKWGSRTAELLYGYQAPTTVAILGLLMAELGLDKYAAAVREVLTPYSGWLTLETGLGFTLPADFVLGRLSLLLGDHAGAVQSLRVGADLTSRLQSPALEARCRWYLADALAEAGDHAASEAERRAAEALAARTGVVLTPASSPSPPALPTSTGAHLSRDGRRWIVESPFGSGEVAHSTGMAQLVRVLAAAPGEVEAVELAGRSDVVERDLGPVLDAAAKRAYRQRLAELRAEIDDADDHADIERAARARLELDALMTELQHAVGLGGRDRPSGSSAEKARINVARSLRRAIASVSAVLPGLGAHLEVSMRTGRTCRYAPDPAAALTWTVDS